MKSTISEYQLCPMCYGEGMCDNIGSSTSVKRQCPVCNGARTLIKPVFSLALTGEQKIKLSEVYGRLWTEAYYDPNNESTANFAKPLVKIMQELNDELKFKE